MESYNMVFSQGKRVIFASLESGYSIAKPIVNLSGGKLSKRLHIYAPSEQVTLEKISNLVRNNIEFFP